MLILRATLCLLLAVVNCEFLWGTATAAYQIEGAYQTDGRGETVWDVFSHTAGKTANSDTGDVADDHYHKFAEDIALMAQMGIKSYRFSISWTRILLNGADVHAVNPKGIEFYNMILDTLEVHNIVPFVTLFHWDTPSDLENRFGGWLNQTMENYFAAYADVCFNAFGGRVKHWLTINEPMTVALNGYLSGEHAPGRCSDRSVCDEGDSATEPYIVAHNMLLAHARAVHTLRSKYAHQKAQIGMAVNTDFAYPFSNTTEDLAAAERDLVFQAGWFSDPTHFGDYPALMKELVGARLPTFTATQKKMLKGSVDFYALNHYSSRYYADCNASCQAAATSAGWFDDQNAIVSNVNSDGEAIGPVAESSWLNVVPRGIRDVLLWLSDRYGSPDIYITENGVDAPGESALALEEALNDTFRVDFYRDYLDNVLQAMAKGVLVKGFFAWSFMDNFEWADGYNCRFGLHYVDYQDPALPRYAKKSAQWYKQFILAHPNP
jgi:beta-glucosidase